MLPTHLAKYPFLPEAAAEVAKYGLSIEDLLLPEYSSVLERAVERISEAISTSPPSVSYRRDDPDVELLSFPVAVVLAASLGDDYVKRRYAVAEAKRASHLLEEEDSEVVYEVARRLGLRVRMVDMQVGLDKYEFAVNFIDYLKAASNLTHEGRWKLVNRLVHGGEIYLGKLDVVRLIEEEVRRRIESKIEAASGVRIPSEIIKRLEQFRRVEAEGYVGGVLASELPSKVDLNMFPPCIKALYEAARVGRNIPHYGRFTLASFLLSVGMDAGSVIEVFKSSPDFRDDKTRYQVEHIAGKRGSGTKYIPPKCESLRTHSLCPGGDDLCRKIKHPLAYYRRRIGVKPRDAERDVEEIGLKKAKKRKRR